LLHSNGPAIHAALTSLQRDGIARRIGVSVYGPAEITAIWPRFTFDVVQAPLNVFDRRLVSSGLLERLNGAGVAVHARSIFLQGLLLMRPDARPVAFEAWSDVFARWDRWLDSAGFSPLEAALRFVLGQSGVERVLVGVDGVDQLEQVIAAADGPLTGAPPELAADDDRLLNPSHWARA
jgi:aryl-alcohol dehydrogenase-like predicted oxidoreductase